MCITAIATPKAKVALEYSAYAGRGSLAEVRFCPDCPGGVVGDGVFERFYVNFDCEHREISLRPRESSDPRSGA